MDRFDAAYMLIHCALDRGGVTLNREGAPLGVNDARWVVAVRPAVSIKVKASVSSRLQTSLWLDVVNGTLAPDEGVGSWLDPGGHIILDVVRFTRSRAEATRLGAACGQDAIYHIVTGSTVYLKGKV